MLFTVIICSQTFIDKCRSAYSGFLKPLLENSKDYAFCPWDITKQTFDEALPDLRRIIDKKKDWRAVAVLDDELYGRQNIEKRNPFNFVDADNSLAELETAEQILKFREDKMQVCRNTIDNPLMKLGIWLDGSPFNGSPELPCEYEELPDVTDEDYFKKLDERHLSALEVEMDRIMQGRKAFIAEHFSTEGELFCKPKQIVAVSERVLSNGHEAAKAAWKSKNEFNYSRFYEENLYPSKFRYVLFDISYVKGARVESDYLNFLVFVLIFAQNSYPADAVRSGKVYCANMEMDKNRINDFYSGYLGKLMSTVRLLEILMKKKTATISEPIDDVTVKENFESDVKVPVVIGSANDTQNLFAEYKGLGLAKDCPTSEESMWDEQSHNIIKNFVRYIREPRRAVKRAAENDLHIRSEIDDERITRLTETQKEDISFRLVEEEDKMVETAVPRIFKSEEYLEQIERENKAVKRTIAHRMTKKTTVTVGLISLTAFLFGLLPLIFNNVNDGEALGAALIIILGSLATLAVAGIIYLFVQRFRLKMRFQWFNKVMRSILADIDNGLDSFSRYFSYACNVMRCFSVLNYSEKVFATRQNIYKKHAWDVEKKIDEITRLFAGYIDPDSCDYHSADPFDYDFSVLCDYDYNIPYEQLTNRITFIQNGNTVEVPINYVGTIILEGEDFYD